MEKTHFPGVLESVQKTRDFKTVTHNIVLILIAVRTVSVLNSYDLMSLLRYE